MVCVRYAVVIAWIGVGSWNIEFEKSQHNLFAQTPRHWSGPALQQEAIHLPKMDAADLCKKQPVAISCERQLSCFRCINPILKYTPIRTLSLVKVMLRCIEAFAGPVDAVFELKDMERDRVHIQFVGVSRGMGDRMLGK
jgi:hypothetical protein